MPPIRSVCLVGHGPSLEGEGRGNCIDAHDVVFRFKKGWQLCTQPFDYGRRCTYLVASTEVPGCFLLPDVHALRREILGYIAYPKYGFYNEHAIESMQGAIGHAIAVPLNLCNMWNYQFRQLGATHPNVSLGMAGIFIAAHELRPARISLAGFDALQTPDKPFTRITSVPRTGTGPFPDHDWPTERRLLEVLAREYQFTYEFIGTPDASAASGTDQQRAVS